MQKLDNYYIKYAQQLEKGFGAYVNKIFDKIEFHQNKENKYYCYFYISYIFVLLGLFLITNLPYIYWLDKGGKDKVIADEIKQQVELEKIQKESSNNNWIDNGF